MTLQYKAILPDEVLDVHNILRMCCRWSLQSPDAPPVHAQVPQEAAAAEAAATAATADHSPAAEPNSLSRDSRRAAKHDTFAEVDNDGQLAETSSNGLGAYVRAGVGNLASDSACIAKAAVTSAVQALTRMSSRKSSGKAYLQLEMQFDMPTHLD